MDAADLPPEILHGRRRKASDESPHAKHPQDVRDAIAALDQQMVRQALALSEGNKAKAAELLKIDVTALEKVMEEAETSK